MSRWTRRAAFRAQRIDDWLTDQMEGSANALSAGEVAEVTDVVASLTGRPPHTFAQFAQAFADDLARGSRAGLS